jgi:hypothetical protein
MKWKGHGDRRHAYRILVGIPKEMRPLGKPRRRWKNNINMDLQAWPGFIWLRIGTCGGLL